MGSGESLSIVTSEILNEDDMMMTDETDTRKDRKTRGVGEKREMRRMKTSSLSYRVAMVSITTACELPL